jgi:hypothetical protein
MDKQEIEGKTKQETIKRIGMVILGILLTPVFFCTFMIDRFLMIFLVMGHAPDIIEYYQDMKYIGISILRSIAVAILSLIIWWLWR